MEFVFIIGIVIIAAIVINIIISCMVVVIFIIIIGTTKRRLMMQGICLVNLMFCNAYLEDIISAIEVTGFILTELYMLANLHA